MQDFFGIGRAFGGCNPISGPTRLQVRAADANDALLILEDLASSR